MPPSTKLAMGDEPTLWLQAPMNRSNLISVNDDAAFGIPPNHLH